MVTEYHAVSVSSSVYFSIRYNEGNFYTYNFPLVDGKTLNSRMVDPSIIFIYGTNIKVSASNKKFQKQKFTQTAKLYEQQLRKEVNEECEKLGKDDGDDHDSHCSNGCRLQQSGANANGQRLQNTHIWQEYLDIVELLRKTECGKNIYAMRKETIERVFAEAKEKHAMRYIHHSYFLPV